MKKNVENIFFGKFFDMDLYKNVYGVGVDDEYDRGYNSGCFMGGGVKCV